MARPTYCQAIGRACHCCDHASGYDVDAMFYKPNGKEEPAPSIDTILKEVWRDG